MSERVPRKNTLQFEFSRLTRSVQPTSFEIHDWLVDVVGITSDQCHTAYYDLEQYCFFVKLVNPLLMDRILMKFPQGIEFRHSDKSVSTVYVYPADAEFKTVRVYNLPPEVENCFLTEVLSQYGQVKTVKNEMWSSKHRLQCFSGIRSVEMQIRCNIPSHVIVGGYKAQVVYTGQTATCHICNESGHMRQACPKRVTVLKSTLQQRRKLTLSDLLPAANLNQEGNVSNSSSIADTNLSDPSEFPPLHPPVKSASSVRDSGTSKNSSKRPRVADDSASDDDELKPQLPQQPQLTVSLADTLNKQESMDEDLVQSQKSDDTSTAVEKTAVEVGELQKNQEFTHGGIEPMEAEVPKFSVGEVSGDKDKSGDSNTLWSPECQSPGNVLSQSNSLALRETTDVQDKKINTAVASSSDGRRSKLKPQPNLSVSRSQDKTKNGKFEKTPHKASDKISVQDNSKDVNVQPEDAACRPPPGCSRQLHDPMDVSETVQKPE